MRRVSPRSLSVCLTALCAAVLVVVWLSPPALAYLPTPPPAATALANLNTLSVGAESGAGSYDRDLFTHWVTVTGSDQVSPPDGCSRCLPTDSAMRVRDQAVGWPNGWLAGRVGGGARA